MLEKISQAAEQAATSASRREFLGHLGRGAMAAAAAVGGILVLPAISEAGRKPPVVCTGGSPQCIGVTEGTLCLTYSGVGRCSAQKKSTICDCR